jgi:hypothetical protein
LVGKPGEVVVVDGSSDRQTHNVYWQQFQEGLIDKLQIILKNPDYPYTNSSKIFDTSVCAAVVAECRMR